MKYLLVIAPRLISNSIVSESKRLVKTIYGKEINGIYYRAVTVKTQENPRRMFLNGNREILEFNIKPHITLSQDIDITEVNLPIFIATVEKVLANQRSFTLYPLEIGDYGQDFTFYLEYRKNPQIVSLFKKILAVSKSYIPEERYKVYSQRIFIPHTTILYDDIDPIKVKLAEAMLNRDLFDQPVRVTEVELWTLNPNYQDIVHKFPLS
jgi:2'-5' RNA ligase